MVESLLLGQDSRFIGAYAERPSMICRTCDAVALVASVSQRWEYLWTGRKRVCSIFATHARHCMHLKKRPRPLSLRVTSWSSQVGSFAMRLQLKKDAYYKVGSGMVTPSPREASPGLHCVCQCVVGFAKGLSSCRIRPCLPRALSLPSFCRDGHFHVKFHHNRISSRDEVA